MNKAYPIRTPITRTNPGRFWIGPRIEKNPKQQPRASHSPDTNPEYPDFFTGFLVSFYINLNNDEIWFLHFRLFERGRIQKLECV
jgi:hypothetical protein